MSWDYRRVGRALAELLLDRLAGGPAERVVVRATFVPGESCAPPSAARVA
jgi:DNA-binding LacI/PurR family transcriptional regulator